ncbi:MAG: hypothetical protein LBK82_04295 [Planctomycetaceae bacterium]|nr:hypothetical protein [Planctomycetaceae bacterium]
MLPLQGDYSGGTYPPRCGGLACVALAGRRKTRNPTELMNFLPTVRNMSH